MHETVPVKNLFQILIACIAGNKPVPVSAYDLTHPTRLAIQAKQKAIEKQPCVRRNTLYGL